MDIYSDLLVNALPIGANVSALIGCNIGIGLSCFVIETPSEALVFGGLSGFVGYETYDCAVILRTYIDHKKGH